MTYAWGEALPALDAPGVRLRPLRDEDVPALFDIFGDPEVMRYWSSPPLKDISAARALLDGIRRHVDAKSLFQWGIARASDDTLVARARSFTSTTTIAAARLASRWGARIGGTATPGKRWPR